MEIVKRSAVTRAPRKGGKLHKQSIGNFYNGKTILYDARIMDT